MRLVFLLVQQPVRIQISSQTAVIPVWNPVSVTVDLSSALALVCRPINVAASMKVPTTNKAKLSGLMSSVVGFANVITI